VRTPPHRSAGLETLALLAIAASLSAVWLDLWVDWTRGAWLGGAALPGGWPAALAATGLAASALTDLALNQNLPRPRRARAALALLGALAVFVLGGWAMGWPALVSALRGEPGLAARLGPVVPAAAAGLWAWWQGEQLGRGPVGNQALRAAFSTGLLALAPLLFLNSLLSVLPAERLLGALLLYFALGLSGLALSSLRHLRQQQRASHLISPALSRQWLVLTAVVVSLVLGLGLLAVRLTAPALLARLAAALGATLHQAALLLGVALSPLASAIDRLLAFSLPGLAAFLERFITALGIAFERLQGLFALLAALAGQAAPRAHLGQRLQALLASPVFQVGARWAGLLAALAAAAIIFWLAARRLWRLQSGDEDEERESVLSGHLLLAQLKSLLRGRRARRAAALPAYLALSGAPDDARLIIRRAYQAMLEWARSLRLPRAAGQTPRDYGQMLAGAVPEGHEAIDLLTQAYMLARYAAEAPSLEHARRAEGAMARLKALHS
jgi:hypothetical protein